MGNCLPLCRKKRQHIPFKKIKNHENEEYVPVSKLGRGTFGKLYKVTDSHGNELACKVVRPRETTSTELCLWPHFEHPNIAPVLDMFDFRGFNLFVTPIYDSNLEKLFRSTSFLTKPNSFFTAKKLMYEVASGLNFLHTSKICHMDLQPRNIWVMKDVKAVLADFGCAASSEDPVKRYGLRLTSCPPECWNPQFTPIDHTILPSLHIFDLKHKMYNRPKVDGIAFDIWTCGMTALSCFTGFEPAKLKLTKKADWWKAQRPLLLKLFEVSAFEDILKARFPRSQIDKSECWHMLNFVTGLLRVDPNSRPRTQKILEHITMPLNMTSKYFICDDAWKQRVTAVHGQQPESTEINKIPKLKGKIRHILNNANFVAEDMRRNSAPEKGNDEKLSKTTESQRIHQLGPKILELINNAIFISQSIKKTREAL